MACNVLFQWQDVRIRHKKREHHKIVIENQRRGVWIRSLVGEVKCNVDVGIFKDQGCYGIGMCSRANRKDFMASKTAWYRGLP